MVYSQSGYNGRSPRSYSSDTMRITVSLKGVSISLIIHAAADLAFTVLEGGPHPCRLYYPRTPGKCPTGISLFQGSVSDPCPPQLLCPEQLKEPVCKCGHPFRLDCVRNSCPFFPFWEPSWLYRINDIFQTNSDFRSKGSSIQKTILLAKMFSKGKLTCWS